MKESKHDKKGRKVEFYAIRLLRSPEEFLFHASNCLEIMQFEKNRIKLNKIKLFNLN